MAIPVAKIETQQVTDFARAQGVGADFAVGLGQGDVDLTEFPVSRADMGPTQVVTFVSGGDFRFMDAFGNIVTWTGVLAGEPYNIRMLGIYEVGTTGTKVRVGW